MPIHDLYCDVCGRQSPNTYCPLVTLPVPEVHAGFVTTQRVDFPRCCATPMTYHPPAVVMDAYEPFQEFETTVDGPGGTEETVLVDSLTKLRAVERASEQRERNGEGRKMVWRDFSQDRSNADVHTAGPDPSQTLTREEKQRFGGPLRTQVAENPAYGPGITDANVSALKGEG